ncbi:Tox-REase-5 domain-containing protein [Rhizohabitans arisaemae]|uniref:Tox-REase-5 domain-containing protein n=1 Tax=Rhizohabitans arisaemae TaxID=2720610 RepID=UPI0024B04771|nr:Tox-REase-5 domain-containing protein [Rhizohabitans arisaemae]
MAARIRSIADVLPLETMESGREHLETAVHTLFPVADGTSSPLPVEALEHFAEASARLAEAHNLLRKGHDLVLLYAATLLGHGWVAAPPRHHGAPFNADYEEWVRRECGGPPGREYLIMRTGEKVLFDAMRIEQRNGVPVEVLVDAKGRYAQFIDKTTGTFHKWWARSKNSGLPEMLERALKQIKAGGGRRVEWWCAEPEVARLFNDEFEDDDRLEGRIRAVYRPMPPG